MEFSTGHFMVFFHTFLLCSPENINRWSPPNVLRDDPQGRLQRSGEGGNHRQLDLVKDARLTRSYGGPKRNGDMENS